MTKEKNKNSNFSSKKLEDNLRNIVQGIGSKKSFDAKNYSHTEEYVCSFVHIKSSNVEAYHKYANLDTFRSSSLEEAIIKGIKLVNTENNRNSFYISSIGLSATSPWDEDEGYKIITEPSQIKVSKDGNNYQITKEYGNIFDDSKQKIKHEINVIKQETIVQLRKNTYTYNYEYWKERADETTATILNKNFSKVRDPDNQPQIFNYKSGSGAKTSKNIEVELLKYKPKYLIPFVANRIIRKAAEEIEDNLKYLDPIIKGIEKDISKVYQYRDNRIKEEKKRLRMINRLEKTMQFTLKNDEKIKLSEDSLKVMDRKFLGHNHLKPKSLII